MLQFIFGLPLSGKTACILKNVKALAKEGKKSIIIVPEQASFETEKAVFNTLGDSFSLNVEILSFSRLYDEVCRKFGGIAARNLNDSDKIIFMSKALKQIAPELKLWGKYAKSLTFAKNMLDAIGEFKINGISSAEISNAAKDSQSQNLKLKLTDLSLIYETYDSLTEERFIDPVDKLTRLYRMLENNNYFEGKTVFFDGFKGFTGQQYKIIDRIFTKADDLIFAFTNDAKASSEYDVFSNIRLAVSKIEKLAQMHGKEVKEPIVLNYSKFTAPSLFYLERLLCENGEKSQCGDSVAICKANSVFDEADFAARTIRKLIRTENMRFKDFAIITRDSDKYYQAVQYACQKTGVECFFDKKVSLLSFPLTVAVLSAINSLDFSSENILRFHKSGLDLLSTDEISELENYVYLWNINGNLWLKEWDMDVRGFVSEEQNEHTILSLQKINKLRERAIKPILDFKNNFQGNVKQMSKAVIKLLEDCNVSASLNNLSEHFGNDAFLDDVLKQSFDAFMNVLDSIVTCYNLTTISVAEYYKALYLAFSLEEVGIIPQTLDQVIFGQADRIRPSSPKVVFILGANQGVFPKFSNNNGIFATKERKALVELGLEINDNEIFDSIDENYLVYCNLCSASEKVFICYSTSTLKGEKLEPSAFVSAIESQLNPKIYFEPSERIDETSLPETAKAAFSEFCRRFGETEGFSTIKTALESDDNNNISSFSNTFSHKNNSISRENAAKLYGKTINMSATKFDAFHRCKFSHFCKYGLSLKRLQPADFDVLQRGTIVHYVLEKTISEYKENIKDLSREELDIICDKYINEYLDSVSGYRSVQTARHEFLISKISRSLKEVLYHLSLEFAQSDFKPVHCELAIGGKDGIPLKFPFNGGELVINGSIDRVDTFGGYIRIVDYKTGTKSFKLPDILFGLNLQMLIYLYAVTRGQSFSDDSAAGIFYMPSKRDLNNEGMAMNGLMVGDIDLVEAMEKDNKGEFIPKLSINKDGTIAKTATSFITKEEFGQIFDYIEKIMADTGNSIANGEIEISPVDGRESTACGYCDFKSICGIEDKASFKVPNLKNSEVFEIIAKEKENGI